ncbi:HAD family hydrolase [Desulfovibrio mangrovi]|uniref:D-glycero-alpha-D-manno-heptose-1,7-bisphosphate 7-phosphatase n=1 Tax=Desulfovibrio mangrovi TaxID=2976983 RepID=UPI002248076D|nr:HAD family hydrolase [Desulfovibrio mangrovi]UZP67928.1 HAD family hydrolase [Desulfovibrio mangrovi]
MPRIRNILLDRDGTVILDKHYQHDPDELEFENGAVEGLGLLAAEGMRFFVLTNQSGIGRGYFSEEAMNACIARLDSMLAGHGVVVTETVFCPHAPDDTCNCRKPALGMWEVLREKYGLLPEESVMIGDKVADVELGLRAGLAASILVLTGKGEKHARKLSLPDFDFSSQSLWMETARTEGGWPQCVARDLVGAAQWILESLHEGEA